MCVHTFNRPVPSLSVELMPLSVTTWQELCDEPEGTQQIEQDELVSVDAAKQFHSRQSRTHSTRKGLMPRHPLWRRRMFTPRRSRDHGSNVAMPTNPPTKRGSDPLANEGPDHPANEGGDHRLSPWPGAQRRRLLILETVCCAITLMSCTNSRGGASSSTAKLC